MTSLKAELFGAGATLCAAIFIFYAIDPWARRVILAEKLLKIWVYSLTLISFNLWLRVDMRLKKWDVNGPKAIKEHIKLTGFFMFMLALMELPLFIARF